MRVFRRLLDIGIAAAGLILLSPLLAVIALSIAWRIGRPVLFRHVRVGMNEELFVLYKFRTMTDERDEEGRLLPDGERLTPLGGMLRAASLDELPQLWNVLKGDMNLVGPRPLIVEYLPRYNEKQRRRHEVKPGITGWAQIHGRNGISWEEKFDLDVWYVDHRSLWLDLKILAVTLLRVVQREGITEAGQATASEFLGTAVCAAHGERSRGGTAVL